jgi:RNA polymerase sigma factor (TIGR02999 family)
MPMTDSSPPPHTASDGPSPDMPSDPPLTELLSRASGGDRQATDDLFPLVYRELRQLADRYLSAEHAAQTLQPTALVHEAYLRLVGPADVGWQSRAHFFGAATQAIRRILIDRARARQRHKRGDGGRPLELEAAAGITVEGPSLDLLALDEALQRLAALDARKARIVELRFFGGLSVDETAAMTEVSPATVAREWQFARAWLHREMSGERPA